MTDEQQLLRDSATRYLRDNYDFNARLARSDRGELMSDQHWAAFVEMGWLALPFDEAHGGFGFGMEDVAMLMEEFGRHLVVEPFLESAVACGGFLAHGDVSGGEALLERVIAGEAIVALANEEPDGVRDSDSLGTAARAEGDGYRLVGHKTFVAAGAVATHFLLTARLDHDVAVFLVPADTPGLERSGYPTYDGRNGANLALDLAAGAEQLLARGDAALSALDDLRSRAILASSAEAVGAMQAALDATVDYTRQRVQFGQPLSAFQALQHRMADMLIELELSRSLVHAACRAHDTQSPEARRLVLAAKVKVAAAARRVTQEAIQLHGGIATTREYIVGHFFKRVAALESWPCSRTDALAELIELDTDSKQSHASTGGE